jgi:hypothetical protein
MPYVPISTFAAYQLGINYSLVPNGEAGHPCTHLKRGRTTIGNYCMSAFLSPEFVDNALCLTDGLVTSGLLNPRASSCCGSSTQYFTRFARLLSLQFVVVVFAFSGCRDASPRVYGTVSLDGANIENGYIRFVIKEGNGAAFGGKISDGKYDVKAKKGLARVEIQAYQEVAPPTGVETKGMAAVPTMRSILPANFNTKSNRTLSIEKDVVEYNIELKRR